MDGKKMFEAMREHKFVSLDDEGNPQPMGWDGMRRVLARHKPIHQGKEKAFDYEGLALALMLIARFATRDDPEGQKLIAEAQQHFLNPDYEDDSNW